MPLDDAARPDPDRPLQDGVRPDDDVGRELHLGSDHGCRMDQFRHGQHHHRFPPEMAIGGGRPGLPHEGIGTGFTTT